MVMTSTASPENNTGLTALAHTTRIIRESKVQEPGFFFRKKCLYTQGNVRKNAIYISFIAVAKKVKKF